MAVSRSPEPRASATEAGAFPIVFPQLDVLLWIFLVLVAAGLRLIRLAAAPLSGPEARQALAAYEAVYGGIPAAVIDIGSPLLYHFNVLLSMLFESGDAWARLGPALAGVGLVLTPLLLRRHLGRWGSLGMGLFLALSPTAVLFSRTLVDTLPAALGIMLLVGGVARYFDTHRLAWGMLAAFGLAFAIAAGAAAWGFLLGLTLSLGFTIGLWTWRDRMEEIAATLAPLVRPGLLVGGGALLLLSTGLLLHPAGLAATGTQFLEWLGRFGLPGEMFTPAPLTLMLTYEPLVLVLGLAGLVLALSRRQGLGQFLSLWAVVSWLQLTLTLGREPSDLLWLILPMAGLAGLAVEGLVDSLLAHGHWLNEGLYLPVSLILWGHFGLTLAAYAQRGQSRDLLMVGLSLLLQLFLLIIFGLIFAFPDPELESDAEFVFRRSVGAALRAGGLTVGIVLLVVNLSLAWGAAGGRPADPRELLVSRPTAIEVQVLTDVVEHIGLLEAGATPSLPLTLVGEPDPVLAWYFRAYDLDFVPQLSPEGAVLEGQPPLVLAPVTQQPPEEYFGEIFPLQRDWSPVWAGPVTIFRAEDAQEFFKWWLYRGTSSPPAVTRWVALWVREDLSTSGLTFRELGE